VLAKEKYGLRGRELHDELGSALLLAQFMLAIPFGALAGGWLAARGIAHHVLVWTDPKPATGIQEAARAARYRLLAGWCREQGCLHLLTAHHRDDQAETLLMRLLRGSGMVGLSAMARESERDGVLLARPFLNVSKSQLVATLKKAKIGFIEDPTNRDLNFTRPRIRALMPVLAAEGEPVHLVRPPDTALPPGARRYVRRGERAGPHRGYKCRSRTPWYVVPSVWVPPRGSSR